MPRTPVSPQVTGSIVLKTKARGATMQREATRKVHMQLNRERQPSIRRNDRVSKREARAASPAPQFPMTTFAMRGAAMIWDMQVETARTLWRTQARAAAMLGFPDYSRLFDAGDRAVRDVVAATTEQVLDRAHETTATVTQLQREI